MKTPTINTTTATAPELLAFFNAHSGQPAVKRFSDRAAGQRRVEALLQALAAAPAPSKAKAAPAAPAKPEVAPYTQGVCPACGATADITCGTVKEHRGGHQTIEREHEAFCHGCGHEFNWETGAPLRVAAASATRAAAIAESWRDPEVAAARARRHAVRCAGQEYGSVAKAFAALQLPSSRIIAFRGQLRLLGKATIGEHHFTLAK